MLRHVRTPRSEFAHPALAGPDGEVSRGGDGSREVELRRVETKYSTVLPIVPNASLTGYILNSSELFKEVCCDHSEYCIFGQIFATGSAEIHGISVCIFLCCFCFFRISAL